MTIIVNAETSKDRGQPYRKLTDGTHEATVITCEQYMKNSLSLKVGVCVHPKDGTKSAPEGPVLVDTYIPMEITDKNKDTARLLQYIAAMGGKAGVPFEEATTIGKPVRVVTRWTPSRDQGFPDRAEIKGFLPALPGQKPIELPPVPESEPHPFGGDGEGS